MTAATAPIPAATTSMPRRAKVGLGALAWLTFRQHRLVIGSTALLYVLCGLFVEIGGNEVLVMSIQVDPMLLVPALAGVIAVFWGAPLLATEYEQRTNILVWSQDVSPLRWLIAKLTMLGGVVVVLSGGLAPIVRAKAIEAFQTENYFGSPLAPSGWIRYESWLPLSLAYALFGLAFGVAVSALCRRIVASIGITLVGFAAIRYLIGDVVRPWLMNSMITPVRWTSPLSNWLTHSAGPAFPSLDNYLVPGELWLTRTGQVLDFPMDCNGPVNTQFVHCLAGHGIVAQGQDYQPYGRIIGFQSIELAIYLLFIAVCVGLAVWSVRRKAVGR